MPACPRSVRKTIALVLVAAIGMYVMMLTLSTALSLRIATIDPAGKETTYGLAVSIGAFLMLVTVPLGGALSEPTTSRLGRRRPWIIGCLIPALLAMVVIGLVSVIPVIVCAYVIGIATAQAAFDAYAVIPVEGVPDNWRARVMGLVGLFGALAFSAGPYLAAALVETPLLMMTVPVLLAIVTSLPLLLLYRDPAKSKAETYIAWTAFDNFEWISGFRPKFGLIAVDRAAADPEAERVLARPGRPNQRRRALGG